jgi:hypothetical protein
VTGRHGRGLARTFAAVVVTLVLGVVAGCTDRPREGFLAPQLGGFSYEITDKWYFAVEGEFIQGQDRVGGTPMKVRYLGNASVLYLTENGYTDLAFVADESQAIGYPDDILVVWPTDDTAKIIEALNDMIDFSVNPGRELIDLTQDRERVLDSGDDYVGGSLTYPVTMGQALTQPADVFALLHSLPPDAFNVVLRSAEFG